MKTKITALLAALLLASSISFAQDNSEHTRHSKAYVGADVSYGGAFHDRTFVPDYEIRLFAGYSPVPQFKAAIGFGGANTYQSGLTVVPVFLQLRSDFLSRTRVTPFIAVDAGFNFHLVPARQWEQLKVNEEVFTEKLTVDGHKYTVTEFLNEFYADNHAAGMDYLTAFSNGKHEYAEIDGKYFSKNGWFASFSIGSSFRLSGVNLDLSLVAGFSQFAVGPEYRTLENEFLSFKNVEKLPDGTKVYVQSIDRSYRTLVPDCRIRLGVSF